MNKLRGLFFFVPIEHIFSKCLQINDRYEFPLQLDLDREDRKYLSPDSNRSVRNLYSLHRLFIVVKHQCSLYGRLIWQDLTLLHTCVDICLCMYMHTLIYICSCCISYFVGCVLNQIIFCSVLVHKGGEHGGHYYAFIRPTLSDQWYCLFIIHFFDKYILGIYTKLTLCLFTMDLRGFVKF